MIPKLPIAAVEKSTYFPVASFFDEDGNAEDVKTLTWTLTDILGNIINEREDVEVTNPSSVETIVLSGDDLALFANDRLRRIITFNATYDSDLGSDLPLNGAAEFTIVQLVSITDEA